MKAALALPLALLMTVAGCLAPAAPLDANAATDADHALGLPEPQVLVWNGHMVAGAAFEVPAHFQPSEQMTEPLWLSGFILEIAEAPELLEIQLDWTSVGPSDLFFMVHAPHGAEREGEDGWSEYATAYSMQSPLCMRIPAKDIAADLEGARHHGAEPYWYPMAHSRAGADVQLTFTVRSVGGSVAIPDMYHGHPTNAEELVNIAETELGPKRAWDACGAA